MIQTVQRHKPISTPSLLLRPNDNAAPQNVLHITIQIINKLQSFFTDPKQ